MMIIVGLTESDWIVKDEAKECGVSVAEEESCSGKHRNHTGPFSFQLLCTLSGIFNWSSWTL